MCNYSVCPDSAVLSRQCSCGSRVGSRVLAISISVPQSKPSADNRFKSCTCCLQVAIAHRNKHLFMAAWESWQDRLLKAQEKRQKESLAVVILQRKVGLPIQCVHTVQSTRHSGSMLNLIPENIFLILLKKLRCHKYKPYGRSSHKHGVQG